MFGCQHIHKINFLEDILMEHYLHLNASPTFWSSSIETWFLVKLLFHQATSACGKHNPQHICGRNQNSFSIICNNYWFVFFISLFLLSCAKRAYESQVVLVICCFLIWALFPCFCCPLLLILPHEFPWHLSITTLSSSLYPTIGSISFLSQFIPYRQVI